MIIGMIGRKGVGKNYVADVIASELREDRVVEMLAFADPMKEFCINCLGIQRELICGSDKDKNTPTHYKWEKMPPFIREKFPERTGAMTIRHVIQVVGTEMCRGIWGENVWIDAMSRRIVESDVRSARAGQSPTAIVITDVRFPDEAQAIGGWGGKLWRVKGPPRGDAAVFNDSHRSEALVDSLPHDHVIMNEGDGDAGIKAQVRALLNQEHNAQE